MNLYRYGQQKAHKAVSDAIACGKIHPAGVYKCVDCDDPAMVYDHRDYNKPLDVVPVCVSCNLLRGKAKPLDKLPLFKKRAHIDNLLDYFGTRREVANRFDVSIHTVYSWLKYREFPICRAEQAERLTGGKFKVRVKN